MSSSAASASSYTKKLGSARNLGLAGISAGLAGLASIVFSPGLFLEVGKSKSGNKGKLINTEYVKAGPRPYPFHWTAVLVHAIVAALVVFLLCVFIFPTLL